MSILNFSGTLINTDTTSIDKKATYGGLLFIIFIIFRNANTKNHYIHRADRFKHNASVWPSTQRI